MRRLVAHQAVTVDLDDGVDFNGGYIDCWVRTVLGPVATLDPADDVASGLQERLTPGSLSFMTFTDGAAQVALRGVSLAVSKSEAIEFVVIDGIHVPERRTAARVALVTPVRAALVDADGTVAATVATVTANLSMGGAMLTTRPGLGNRPRWQIDLALPRDPQPVRCDADLVRQTPTHIAVKFANMQETDQLRLAAILAEHQRRTPPGA